MPYFITAISFLCLALVFLGLIADSIEAWSNNQDRKARERARDGTS